MLNHRWHFEWSGKSPLLTATFSSAFLACLQIFISALKNFNLMPFSAVGISVLHLFQSLLSCLIIIILDGRNRCFEDTLMQFSSEKIFCRVTHIVSILHLRSWDQFLRGTFTPSEVIYSWLGIEIFISRLWAVAKFWVNWIWNFVLCVQSNNTRRETISAILDRTHITPRSSW